MMNTFRLYILPLLVVLLIIGGLTYYFARPGAGDSWNISMPTNNYEAQDEFVPVEIEVSFSRAAHEGTLVGNFWLVLKSPGGEETYVLPFFPREVDEKMLDNDMPGSISIGNHPTVAYDTPHTFTGFAYLSPLIHDGTYELSAAIGRMEGADFDTPYILSKSSSQAFVVKREFQTKRSIDVAELNTTQAPEDTTRPAFRLRMTARDEAITLRAFEIGTENAFRPPRGITSLALYDGDTGEKLSDLTDTWTYARTLDEFTPFVVDTPVVLEKGIPRVLEIRATVDADALRKEGGMLKLVRIYGINEFEQKIAEQVQLETEVR